MGVLANKVAVITGASRGLGLAMARAYAREGAAVVLSARSQKLVEQAVDEINHHGLHAAGLACDVADLNQMQALADLAVDRFGRLDVWVNNAGISAPYGPTTQITPQDFERTLRTNIFGTYHGSLTALRHFSAQGSGKLINLLGRGDDIAAPLQSAYGSSKAWIRWFTKSLAGEVKGQHIEVMALNPGLMITDMLNHIDAVEGYEEKVKPLATVMRMWGNPPELPAEKAVWMASTATDGKNGLEVKVLTGELILRGAIQEGLRRILRQPTPPSSMQVTTVKPYPEEK